MELQNLHLQLTQMEYFLCINKPFAVRIFKAGYISTRMTIGKAPKYLCKNTKDLQNWF